MADGVGSLFRKTLRQGRPGAKRGAVAAVRRLEEAARNGLAVALCAAACFCSPGANAFGVQAERGELVPIVQAAHRGGAQSGGCPNIVGEWHSWASLLFGPGDTTFRSGGTAIHRSGLTATWKCQDGKILMSWGGGAPELFTVEGDKIVNSIGIVAFTREAAPSPSSEGAAGPSQTKPPAVRAKAPEPPKSLPSKIPPLVEARTRAAKASGYDSRAAIYGGDDVAFVADNSQDPDLSVCSTGSGDPAIAACTRIVEDPKWGDQTRAICLTNRAEHYGVQDHHELAIQDFTHALRLTPNSARIYNARGLSLGLEGEYDRAIQDFSRALELNPKFAAAYYNRGQTRVAQGAYDAAIEDFNRALGLDPTYGLAYAKRGAAYEAKKDYASALRDYGDAIRLDPDYAKAYSDRARVYLASGDSRRAFADDSTAIRLQPNSADYRFSRARVAVSLYAANLALADLDAAILLSPGRADLHSFRAIVRSGLRDDAGADEDWDQAIALDPAAAPAVWSTKGEARYLAGNLVEATACYDEAVKLAPNEALLYVGRGKIWDARGERGRAIRDYTQALALLPGARSAHKLRGLAYFGQGEFALAAEDLEFAAKEEDDYRDVLWWVLASERGGRKDAGQALQEASAKLKADVWPEPIFRLFRGDSSPDLVLAAAKTEQERCEAQAFAGEWLALRGSSADASKILQAATSACPPGSTEARLAAEELRRVEGQHESR